MSKANKPWQELLESYEEKFCRTIGKQRPWDAWWNTTLLWVAKNEHEPRLNKKDSQGNACVSALQFITAYMDAAKLGLMVDGEECLVQVRGQKTPTIRCEVGYKGVIRKAGQAGERITTGVFKIGDRIEVDEAGGKVSHTPAWLCGETQGETIGFYAMATARDGRTTVRTLSAEEARGRAPHTSNIWKKHFDEMGRKSAILSLRKVLYFGDEIEDLMQAGAAFEDAFDEPGEDDLPEHPPSSARDKVLAANARRQQDEDAEMPEPPPDEWTEEGQRAAQQGEPFTAGDEDLDALPL